MQALTVTSIRSTSRLLGLLGCLLVGARDARPQAAAPSTAELDARGALEAVRRSEYRFTAVGAADFTAPNRAHDLRARFDVEGVKITPRTGDEHPWQVSLRTTRLVRGDSARTLERNAPQRRDERIEFDGAGVQEWFTNDERGLEQGWTLSTRPPGVGGDVVLEVEVCGDLCVQIAPDGRFAALVDGLGRPTLRYHSLAAWDATGRSLPVRLGSAVGGWAIVLDDEAAQYPVTIDPVIGRWPWIYNGTRPDADFGWSVANAGDVDGNGLDDVIVGAPNYDYGETNEGAAFLFPGSHTSGLGFMNPVGFGQWWVEGNQAGAALGYSVAAAGDVNGDGYDDVLVGAPSYTNGQTHEGKVHLYLGSATGLTPSSAWGYESNQANASLGISVVGAGDVNQDGYDDVLIGSPGWSNTNSGEGAALLFLGSASGLPASASWSSFGGQPGAEFGISVASAGDVDGDGRRDVVVGARGYDNGQVDEGQAFVFLGNGTAFDSSPTWTAESDQAGARFGETVAGAGDVDNDGYDDVMVGAFSYDEPGRADAGRAWVYRGKPRTPGSMSGVTATAAWTQGGTQPNGHFGISLAGLGDIDGDGRGEVAIGADHEDLPNRVDAGVVRVYSGTTSGISALASRTYGGDAADARLGQSVARGGDLNGDGLRDFLVGAPGRDQARGRILAFLGSASALSVSPAWTAESNQASSDCGASVASAGDVNNDGFDDVIVGAPGFGFDQAARGRAFLYLGSAGGLAATPAWTTDGGRGVGKFGSSVASAGDVNNDGFGDVIVGAPVSSNDQLTEGRAFLYLGSASGLSPTPAWTAESDVVSGTLGCSVASAGDVNNDGFDDVVVGANQLTNGQLYEGRAYLYLGSASGLSATPAWTAESDQADAYFASSVASAGDVNNDGFDDVIVGAYKFDNGQSDEGRAFLYLGSASGLSATPAWTAESDQAGSFFGVSVASAGDVNNDGFDDVIVGANWFLNVQGVEGRAFLYLGSANGLGASPDWTAESDFVFAYFGGAVATAGDVNNDGFDDVIVGASGYGNGQGSEGRAFVYLGSSSGLSVIPTWAAESDMLGASFGRSVASAGDVNNDGFDDVVVGAPRFSSGLTNVGRAFLYLGGGAPTSPDCNANSRPDEDDLQLGTSTDLNLNLVPDECETLAPAPYCFGDTSAGRNCPCSNVGSTGRGCPNSTPGSTGAQLSATGSASIGADTVSLIASDITGPALFFQGTMSTISVFGDGLRCASGGVTRLGVVFPTAGSATYPGGSTPGPIHVKGNVTQPMLRYYQCWYRDSVDFCTTSTFNLTNGLILYWTP